MSRWLKRLVLAGALVLMPLQGIAATLSVVLCEGETERHAVHANGGYDRGTHQDGNQDEGSTNSDSAYHPCHNTASAPLVATLLATAPDFPVRELAPDSLLALFVPEQPQRPPLA